MNHITIDEKACTKCGICTMDCAQHIKGRESADLVHVNPDHPRCDGCLHCYSVCPAGAITPVRSFGIEDTGPGDPNYFQDLLTSRRSVRHFTEEELSKDVLQDLIETAAQIPSGGNRHPVKCLVLLKNGTRSALVTELKKYYAKVLRIMNKPLLRNLIAAFAGKDIRSFFTSTEYRMRLTELLDMLASGKDPLFYNAPAVLLFYSDVDIPTPKEDSILAAYNTSLRAAEKGYGSCFVSMAQKVINKQKGCKSILGIETGATIHSILVVGKPAVRHRRNVYRKPLEFKCA